MVGGTEAQGVERRDRPRAHGEDVPEDAADTSRRALVGLDVARVVVALHLEDAGETVADVDDARVLARPLDHVRPRGRQPAQVLARGLVRAVLVPHRRDDAEFGERRVAPDQAAEAVVLIRRQAVLGHEFGGDRNVVAEHAKGLGRERPVPGGAGRGEPGPGGDPGCPGSRAEAPALATSAGIPARGRPSRCVTGRRSSILPVSGRVGEPAVGRGSPPGPRTQGCAPAPARSSGRDSRSRPRFGSP